MTTDEIKMDDTLAEVRRIKEQCAVEALSRIPKEQAQEEERAIEWFEKRMGRKIPVVDYSMSARKAAQEEVAHA